MGIDLTREQAFWEHLQRQRQENVSYLGGEAMPEPPYGNRAAMDRIASLEAEVARLREVMTVALIALSESDEDDVQQIVDKVGDMLDVALSPVEQHRTKGE